MPQIQVGSVTHKHGGEIFVDLTNEDIERAAGINLPDSVLFRMSIARLIQRMTESEQKETDSQLSVDFSDEEEYFLVRNYFDERENQVVRSLTKEEYEHFNPLVVLFFEAQKKENPQVEA